MEAEVAQMSRQIPPNLAENSRSTIRAVSFKHVQSHQTIHFISGNLTEGNNTKDS